MRRYVLKDTDVGLYWGPKDTLVEPVDEARVFTTAQLRELIQSGEVGPLDVALEVDLVPRLRRGEGEG